MIYNNAPYISIPTWENGQWTHTDFPEKEDYMTFVLSIFKEPGEYDFDETAFEFNKQARKFNKDGFYCDAVYKSKDFLTYWNDEKEKCRRGVIYKNNGKVWYLTREYYMWINFLQIYNKEAKKFEFASVRDVQYHMALYELLAELHGLHCAILKKRQIASSYFHCAKMINLIWFEEGPVIKMGASHKDFINHKGSWRFLQEYRSFLNKNTAWIRPFSPGGEGLWQQQIEETDELTGRKYTVGLRGSMSMHTFEREATNGVGGPCTLFFHEEAGVAPKMDVTIEFLLPALGSGALQTGLFVAAGSVGDLSQCEPLKALIYHPEKNDIFAVKSNLIDEKGTTGMTALFIPEQWSMPPYIDEFGNSLVQEALKAIEEIRATWKKNLSPAKYQFRVSQRPVNIAEAFAFREESIFPTHLLTAQEARIEDKTYPIEFVDMQRAADGKTIEVKTSKRLPIREFPLPPETVDKEGVIEIFERPDPLAKWGTYLASIDPVSEGKTTTSKSLCTIYIMKKPVEVIKRRGEEIIESYVEPAKIVACWTGRFDDITKTHERLEIMIEWYNAWTIVENNISLFIQYMRLKNKQKYLVPKGQILFLKELKSNENVFQEYGWKNTGTIFSSHLLSYLISFLTEEIDVETKPDGEIVKRTYGIERIPDIMAIKEMAAYTPGLNVDRLVALAALVSFFAIQYSTVGAAKRVEQEEDKLQKSQNFHTFKGNSPFVNMGGSGNRMNNGGFRKNPFKNMK